MSCPASYRCHFRRGTLLRAAALAVAMMALAFASTSAADNSNDPKYSDKRLAKWLKGELRTNSLEPKGVSSESRLGCSNPSTARRGPRR